MELEKETIEDVKGRNKDEVSKSFEPQKTLYFLRRKEFSIKIVTTAFGDGLSHLDLSQGIS